jgi:hypothetical protein
MIERHDGVEEQEQAVGNPALARMAIRDVFEHPDRVVPEKTHRSRGKRRQVRVLLETRQDRQALESAKRPALDRPALAPPLLLRRLPAQRQPRDGLASQERVTGNGFASLDALEEEAFGARLPHPAKKRDRSDRVGGKDARHGHDAPRACAREEVAPFRLARAHGLRLLSRAELTERGGRPRAVIAAAR